MVVEEFVSRETWRKRSDVDECCEKERRREGMEDTTARLKCSRSSISM